MTEYNVGESDGTVEVVLVANGTSDFNYTVNLTVYDVTTGELVHVCVCVCVCKCKCKCKCLYGCVSLCASMRTCVLCMCVNIVFVLYVHIILYVMYMSMPSM